MDCSMKTDREPLFGPQVQVVDGSGKVLCEGYYFAMPERSGYALHDGAPDTVPLREGVMTYDQGDWGMANGPVLLWVKPPHRIVGVSHG